MTKNVAEEFDLAQITTSTKKTVDLKNAESAALTFKGDTIDGQIVHQASGNNIIVMAFGTKQVEDTTVVDYDKLLVTATFKNFNKVNEKCDKFVLKSDEEYEETDDLFTMDYDPTFKKGTWTGTDLNDSVESDAINETFKLAGGNNVIEFNVLKDESEKDVAFGEDKVIAKGNTDTLLFDDDYALTFTRDGKDVVITATKGEDESAITGTVTVKDYLKKEGQNVYIGESSLKNIVEDELETMEIVDKSKKGNAKLEGTWITEGIIGGDGNNKITTGTGDDYVLASAGKDTLTIDGVGDKNLSLDSAASEAAIATTDYSSTTTVSFKKGVNLVPPNKENDPEAASLNVKFAWDEEEEPTGVITYAKKGNDLYVEQDWTGEKITDPDKSAAVIVKDFFNSKKPQIANAVTFDEEYLVDALADSKSGKLTQIGKGKITGTEYNDYLIGSKKADKITVTAVGDDIVEGAEGNDKITISAKAADKESGTKTLNFEKGSGKDTVIFATDADASVVLNNNANVKEVGGVVSYEKTGNDLIMKTVYAKDPEDRKSKDVTDTVTVKDYFAKAQDVKFTVANTSEAEDAPETIDVDLKTAVGDEYLTVNGVSSKSGSFKGTSFLGTDLNDSMTYTGKGNAFMYDIGGDDKYNVTLTKKSNLTIYDTFVSEEGKNKVDFTNSSENLRIFFNANKNGVVITQGTTDTDDLTILNADSLTKSNIKNVVKGKGSGFAIVDSYFGTTNAEDDVADMFTFYSTEKKGDLSALTILDMDSYISEVTSSVTAWFNDDANKAYADKTAMDVFASNDNAAITSLLAAYNVAYETPEVG